MPTNIKNALKRYGLQDGEAELYQLLLKRIEATVFQLAQDAAIPRTSTYAALESLKRKGLATSFKKNNVLYYTPESPRRLLTLLQEQERLINDALPEMEALVSKSQLKPIVRTYSGREGIKLVLENIIETLQAKQANELIAMSNPELLEYLPKFFPDWIERLVKTGAHRRLLLSEQARKIKSYYQDNRNRETRFLPPDYPYQASFDVYGNKVALFSIRGSEAFAVIIESENVAQMYRALFSFAWDQLPSGLSARRA